MKIPIDQLTIRQLNWAVGKCLEIEVRVAPDKLYIESKSHDRTEDTWSPATDWAQGGLIIEHGRINMVTRFSPTGMHWEAMKYDEGTLQYWYNQVGPTPLIAAMRCLYASKRGSHTINLPEHML